MQTEAIFFFSPLLFSVRMSLRLRVMFRLGLWFRLGFTYELGRGATFNFRIRFGLG